MNNAEKLKIVALIPARSGSKGIPHKNIKEYSNIPLICHSIKIAKESSYIDDIIVTKLAQGIPIGGEVHYLDENTLNTAFQSRKKIV